MELESRAFGDGVHVLVAASRKIDEQNRFARQRAGELRRVRERVTRLERWNDPFDPTAIMERRERLRIGDRHVLGATAVLEPRMLRANAGIVEARRNGVRLENLAIVVLQEIGA